MSTTQTQAPATHNDKGASAIRFLRSPLATLIVLCSALLAQLPHAADVFRLIVAGDGWPAILHGFTYAVALELAVLLFVVQHRNVESYMFAGVSILVNLSYYYLHGVALLSVEALPAWLVSIALPAAIAQYSHLIVAATEHGETHATTAPATAKRRTWHFWRKAQETTPRANDTTSTLQTPVALPSVTTAHSDANSVPAAPAVESPKQGKATRKPAPPLRKVGKTNEYGMTDTALGDLLGVSRQRVGTMRNDGTLKTRVARELPQLEPIHTNGTGH